MEGKVGGAGAGGTESTSRERGLAFRRDLSLAAGSSGGVVGFDGVDEATGALKETFLGGIATQKTMDLRRWRGMSAEGAARAWESGTQVVVKGKEADDLLGVGIRRDRVNRKLYLSQKQYIVDILLNLVISQLILGVHY